MTQEEIIVEDIHSYLRLVQEKTEKMNRMLNSDYYCYRGENQVYENHSLPNLFRDDMFEMYQSIKGFEKNIIEEVSVNKLTDHGTDLEIAMDAQHGGFPSRLLDITFNSLNALFFAVTPHYTRDVVSGDNKDGQVIIYAIDKMVTSNSPYIQKLYNDLIINNGYTERFNGYYHYLIDYVELNSRIKAQQGGFILFLGNQYIKLPKWKQQIIKIPKKSKPLLREQLELFFGINMGSIYPEPSNKVEYLVEKAKLLTHKYDHHENIVEEIKKNVEWYEKRINYLEVNEQFEKRKVKMIELERYMYEIIDSLKDYKEKIELQKECTGKNGNTDTKMGLKIDNIDNKVRTIFNQTIKKVNSRYGEKTMKKFELKKEGE